MKSISAFSLQPSALVTPPCYPARPVNGGPLEKALPKSGRWIYGGKYNGWRAWHHNPTGRLFNRKLEPLSITAEFAAASAILRPWPWEWSDVEALERRHQIGQGTLILLDTLMPGDYDSRRMFQRAAAIDLGIPEHIYAGQPIAANSVYLPLVLDYGAELAGWDALQEANCQLGCKPGSPFWEGLVAKRNDSIYPRQLRSPDIEFPCWMKHRWAF